MKRFLLILVALGAPSFVYCQDHRTPLELAKPRMSGPDVLAVQQRLIDLGYSRIGNADGWFGPLTKEAVSSFQRFYGFLDTGIVDSVTWERLILNTMESKDIELAIKATNTVFDTNLTMTSQDIMGRSTEGGSVDQYYSDGKLVIEDFTFYGEIAKVEFKVIYLSTGIVVLEKDFHYPEPFDVAHAIIENLAYYFVGQTAVEIASGKIKKTKIENLSIYDLIRK